MANKLYEIMVISDDRTSPAIIDDHMSPRTATMVLVTCYADKVVGARCFLPEGGLIR
ncbi:MAG: hypothetical protein R8N23_08295 [Reichenbachiella sp.]|uniref:hypothetical protein n=1 Tax=Reichenbachiella sp. TaxID=2184521 RepID=UPI0029671681|nr:hypothetical protein [Reichenbachiella sp.]MDW3209853.1 hypothetical protein [Reichenbachiella sp.]